MNGHVGRPEFQEGMHVVFDKGRKTPAEILKFRIKHSLMDSLPPFEISRMGNEMIILSIVVFTHPEESGWQEESRNIPEAEARDFLHAVDLSIL